MSAEPPAGDGSDGDAGDVVADDDAGERAEQHALGKHRSGRGAARARTERLIDAADEAAGQEERPALDVGGAHERGEERRREHEPDRRVAGHGARRSHHEEHAGAQFREREGRGLPHGNERQQRGRRQDDANAAPGRDRRNQTHRQQRARRAR